MDTEGKSVIVAKTLGELRKRLAAIKRKEREVIAQARAANRRRT